MLPWLGFEVMSGAASAPTGWAGIGSLTFLGVVITAPTLVLFNYGAERLPAAVTGVMTAAIPALGYLFALLLGEQPDAITALGGGIALIGVLIASWAAPSLDTSPRGRRSMRRTETLTSTRLPDGSQQQCLRFAAGDS
jgi:drug/metabolite transporter (DMT)-like permease